eukprot:NODE_814_length_1847_cov_35.800000_g760_i0.p1 GENE.NODE_814_length_1847_cov_35.800000_g760_i0~~NODE_814_length_1847_cov_35.800000_g760_i0.p1  ORF type:complete len:577 (-),score=121.91 NODE_814_length_1847_cov_35.800000_g760_i0:66-1796(-)
MSCPVPDQFIAALSQLHGSRWESWTDTTLARLLQGLQAILSDGLYPGSCFWDCVEHLEHVTPIHTRWAILGCSPADAVRTVKRAAKDCNATPRQTGQLWVLFSLNHGSLLDSLLTLQRHSDIQAAYYCPEAFLRSARCQEELLTPLHQLHGVETAFTPADLRLFDIHTQAVLLTPFVDNIRAHYQTFIQTNLFATPEQKQRLAAPYMQMVENTQQEFLAFEAAVDLMTSTHTTTSHQLCETQALLEQLRAESAASGPEAANALFPSELPKYREEMWLQFHLRESDVRAALYEWEREIRSLRWTVLAEGQANSHRIADQTGPIQSIEMVRPPPATTQPLAATEACATLQRELSAMTRVLADAEARRDSLERTIAQQAVRLSTSDVKCVLMEEAWDRECLGAELAHSQFRWALNQSRAMTEQLSALLAEKESHRAHAKHLQHELKELRFTLARNLTEKEVAMEMMTAKISQTNLLLSECETKLANTTQSLADAEKQLREQTAYAQELRQVVLTLRADLHSGRGSGRGEASCLLCNVDFTTFLRRHHCRRCDRAACNECCPLRTQPDGVKLRVCYECES